MSGNTFNLPPPPGFRGLDPAAPINVYHRHLPHWRQEGATYFVTFRQADAIPQEQLRLLRRMRAEWERQLDDNRSVGDWRTYAREYTRSAERWLDEGYGACHFRDRRCISELRGRLHHFQDQRYSLTCWAILPNHCHVVIRPFNGHDLEDSIGAIKGVTARSVNRLVGASGRLWEEESYDRIVRDEEHLWRVVQYVGANPRRAGLGGEATFRRWLHPDWIAAGWSFQDVDEGQSSS